MRVSFSLFLFMIPAEIALQTCYAGVLRISGQIESRSEQGFSATEFRPRSIRPLQLIRHWKRTGQAKIAVKCDSEEELLILQATAKSLGICARSIQDA